MQQHGSRERASGRLDFLRLGSRVSRRLLKWALVSGLAASVLVSSGEAWWGYRERTGALEQQFASIGEHVAPTLELSLWSFNEAQIDAQLRSLSHMLSVRAVRLQREGGTEVRFGRQDITDAFAYSLPLDHTDAGRTHHLGTLTLVADLAEFRAAGLAQMGIAFVGNTLVLLLVITMVLFVHHSLVRRRLADVVQELAATAPDDLRRAASLAPASPDLADDEVDELVQAIVRLKADGGMALRELDDRHQQLQYALNDLGSSRALLQSIIDTVPMRVFWKDKALRYLGCNPLFAQDAGLESPAHLVGLEDHCLAWRAQALAYQEDDRAVLASGEAKLGYVEQQPTPTGGILWLRTSKVPLRNAQGEVIGVLGVYDDITELKRNEAELTRYRDSLEVLVEERTRELAVARDHAEAGSRAKSTFLANMSHELRTPMNAIMGMTGLALRRAEDPRLRDQLGKINAASKHLLHVINDILDLSRIEADRLVLEDEVLRLQDIFVGTVNLVAARAEEKGVHLNLELPADLANRMVRGDPVRLGQILLNLAGNAVKFTDAGGSVTLRAFVQRERRDRLRIRMEVQDTGIGIQPQDQKRLFMAFEQADGSTTRRYGGTGLGLAISKRLVELMGGAIGIDSTPGVGSTFWLELPMRLSANARVLSDPGAADSAFASLRARHAGIRVLLAEDDLVNQEVGRALLEEAGLVVDVADNGRSAVALARSQTFAIILMDVQMPELNGLEAARAIRSDSRNADVPILAVTANAFGEDREDCIAAGMDDHVAKPIDPEGLYAILLKWLDASGRDGA